MAAVGRIEAEGFAGRYGRPPDGLAVDPETFADAAWWRSDFASVPLENLVADLRTTIPGVAVPDGAGALALTVDAPTAARGLSVRATFARPDDEIVSTVAQPIRPGVATYTMDVEGAERILSITFETPSTSTLPRKLGLDIRTLTLDGAPVPLGDWIPITWHGASGRLTQAAGGWQYEATLGFAGVVAGLEPTPPALPAVVSADMAQVEPAQMSLELGGQVVALQRVGVATSFPGVAHGDPFFVVSGPALYDLARAIPQPSPTVTEVWSRGDADPTEAIRATGFSVTDLLSAAPVEAQLAQSPQSLAAGMEAAAAIAGLGLVIAGRRGHPLLRAATPRLRVRVAARDGNDPGDDPSDARDRAGRASLLRADRRSPAGWGVLHLMLKAVRSSLGVTYPVPVLVIDWRMLAGVVVAIALASSVALVLSIRSLLRSSVTGVLRGEAE